MHFEKSGYCKSDHFLKRSSSGRSQNNDLDNRKMFTTLNKYKSKLCKITHGIVQGSVLGPLLFLLHIYDLPLASKFKSVLFVDDPNLHLSYQNLKALQLRVNNEIKKVDYWISMNKLTLNYSKYKYMIVSKEDIDTSLFTLKITNLSIERADCIQYLEVLLDDKLSWKYYIQKLHKNYKKYVG